MCNVNREHNGGLYILLKCNSGTRHDYSGTYVRNLSYDITTTENLLSKSGYTAYLTFNDEI